jgi:hypothetical protein
MPQDYKDMFPSEKPSQNSKDKVIHNDDGRDQGPGILHGGQEAKSKENHAGRTDAIGIADVPRRQSDFGAVAVYEPKFKGGGLLGGRAAGGFKFEYKLLAGRQLPPHGLPATGAGSREVELDNGGIRAGSPSSSHAGGSVTDRGHRVLRTERMRPMSARGGETVTVGDRREVGLSFPAAKKKRPSSASIVQRDTPLGTRIAGGGSSVEKTMEVGGFVPAPPPTSSSFAFNSDAIPGSA